VVTEAQQPPISSVMKESSYRVEGVSLAAQMVSASKWALFGEMASRGISPLILLVLVRLLTPDDFGVVAIATMVTAFSQVFWDAGLSRALVQRDGDLEKTANVVFWTNTALGFITYGGLCLSAGLIAQLFRDNRVESLLVVQGVQILLASLSSVHNAILQRSLAFRPLFLVKLLSSAVPSLASIPLACAGFGYWALVAGFLVGSAAQLVLLWKVTPWRPGISYDFALARGLFRFSVWVAGESFLAWVYLWIDSIIVAAYLAPNDLGLYRVGDQLVVTMISLAINPLTPVLFSGFSKLQMEKERLALALINSTVLISMIAVPVTAGLFMAKDSLESVFFGSSWIGIANIIGPLALLHGVTWIMGPQIEAVRATGRPDINTKILFVGMAYSVPLYLLCVPYGLPVFIWARVLSPTLTFGFRVYLAKRLFDFSWRLYLNKIKGMIACVSVFVLCALLVDTLLPEYVVAPARLTFTAGIFVSIALCFIMICRKKLEALLHF
jgi:O-antigen/teichoic acid export membrane protein